MLFHPARKRSIRLLIMYMITTLLFLTSSDLHIHTEQAALTEAHGAAVSISTLTGDLGGSADEINVSPDGVIKMNPPGTLLLAVFLLISLLVACACRRCIMRLRHRAHRLSSYPFYRTPPLRAPPVAS